MRAVSSVTPQVGINRAANQLRDGQAGGFGAFRQLGQLLGGQVNVRASHRVFTIHTFQRGVK